jgi:hypothetical protein
VTLGASLGAGFAFWQRPPPREHIASASSADPQVRKLPTRLRSSLPKADVADGGSMAVDPGSFVDFHDRSDGRARAHEVPLQGGDSTSQLFP